MRFRPAVFGVILAVSSLASGCCWWRPCCCHRCSIADPAAETGTEVVAAPAVEGNEPTLASGQEVQVPSPVEPTAGQ